MSEAENFFQKVKPFDDEAYKRVDMDRLVLYAVAQLEKTNIDPTYEKIVVTVFRMFPKRFLLLGFPGYPDGKRIHDCLWHCTYKTKGWLLGSAKSGYHLTEKGKYVLAKVGRILGGEIGISTALAQKPRRKEHFFIMQLKKTDAYNKFVQGKSREISDIETREALRCGINTPKKIVEENLEKYMEFADKMEANEVKEFLQFIRERIDEEE